jgi:hypothetical protein
MWKLACEAEARAEASSISSTSGVSVGHFDCFHVVVDAAPTFGATNSFTCYVAILL